VPVRPIGESAPAHLHDTTRVPSTGARLLFATHDPCPACGNKYSRNEPPRIAVGLLTLADSHTALCVKSRNHVAPVTLITAVDQFRPVWWSLASSPSSMA